MQFPDLNQEKEKLVATFSRELMTTGYNTRVQECREAAAELARLDGRSAAVNLARDAYLKFHPEAAVHAAVYLARSADGVRFL